MGTRTKDQSYGDMYKGPILWEIYMYTKDQSYGNTYMYRGPILWEHD